MRKVSDTTLKDGENELHFKIKQMSATQAERWTFKMLFLIGGNALSGEVEGLSLSALLSSLSSAPYEKIQELLSDLLACCSIVKDGVEIKLTETNVDGFITERNTLIQLRAEAFKANNFFQGSGLPGFSKSQSPAPVDIRRKG